MTVPSDKTATEREDPGVARRALRVLVWAAGEHTRFGVKLVGQRYELDLPAADPTRAAR